jgi:hypothetical protein
MTMTAPSLALYRALLEATERERDLIAAGDWEGVAAAGAERTRILAELPEHHSAEDRPLVAEALAQVRRNLAAAVATRDRTRATLAHLADGRRALRAYAGTAPAGRFDARR